jgi:hypothetical protein
MKKENYENIICSFIETETYVIFKDQYLKHLDSSDSILRISKIKTITILKVFNHIFNYLTNDINNHYAYKSMSINNIVKELNIKNQIITFCLNLFIEIKILHKINSTMIGVRRLSSKYKLLKIDAQIEEKINITFDTSLELLLNKTYAKLRKQKTRTNDKLKLEKIENKINKLKGYKELFNIINKEGGILKNKFNEKIITNGRISHYFTTINKEYRNYILLNGYKTDSIDFSNSQPTFLANYLMTLSEYNTLDDVKEFYNQCINGNIYEYIAINGNITRNHAKGLWMKVAYGLPYLQLLDHNEVTIINKKAESFYNLFPNVMLFIDEYKNKDIKNNSLFSTFLCELESLVVNPLSKLLIENGYDNITIYDEFIFELSNKENILNIIKKYLNENNIKISIKNSSNESKIESNETILETKENILEELKIKTEEVYIATKEDYFNEIKKYHPTIETVRFFKEHKNEILNELVTKQVKKKSDIIEIVKKYN